ncbi:DUF1631 family protein [Undibacterium arcticum]
MTRAEFLRGFLAVVDIMLPRSALQLFAKADASFSSAAQRQFLDARGIVLNRGAELTREMAQALEHLLNRSFQTAFSTFRPSFSAAYRGNSLALLDSAAFEDELRIDGITKRFRNEAEEPLRDLNIRIALLFEQDNIKERENPFRPYLLSRCIATAVESLHLTPGMTAILIAQLGSELESGVAELYERLNEHLARHGIAANLQLKIKKSPEQPVSPTAGGAGPAQLAALGGGAHGTGDRALGHADGASMAADPPARMVDQLLHLVRGVKPANSAPEAGQPRDQIEVRPVASNAGKGGWLAGAQLVGATLRKFFDEGAASMPVGMPDHPGRPYTPYAPYVPYASAAAHDPAAAFARVGTSAGSSAGPAACGPASPIQNFLRAGTPPDAVLLNDDGEPRNLIAEQRATLNDMARNVNEQMTIDVVAMLFEFILRDQQVPAEVRAQLGRLQFLVLKIALQQPTLLTQKGHPARMMINRIGSISIGLKQVDPSGVRVTAEICRIVDALLADESESPQLFSKLLDEFDAFIAQELSASDHQVERAVQAMETTESRTLRFARTSARMAESLAGLTIDPYLHDFLTSTWVHAIERAGRTDDARAQRYQLLIPDLLWSIVPKNTEQDRAQLLALLPITLSDLREGMTLAGLELPQRQDFIDWLVDVHTHALRATTASAPSLSAIHEHFSRFIDDPERDVPAAVTPTKMAADREFLDEAIRELELDLLLVDQMFDAGHEQHDSAEQGAGSAGSPGIAGLDTDIDAADLDAEESVLAGLRSGVAIEFNLDGHWSRGRLNWISRNASNLVLSVDEHGAPSIISVRTFRRLLKNDRARFIEAAPLFERAVQSLLQTADQMDGEHA